MTSPVLVNKFKKIDFIKRELNLFSKSECSQILKLRIENSPIVDGHLSDLLIFQDQASNEWKPIFTLLNLKLKDFLSRYYEQFFNLLPVERISISHIGFLNDKEGSFTELHYDWEFVKFEERSIIKPFVCLIYLNEVSEGGELLFPLHSIKFEPAMGSTIIFPCNFTYPHLSMPVTEGEKHVCRVTFKVDNICYEVDELEI